LAPIGAIPATESQLSYKQAFCPSKSALFYPDFMNAISPPATLPLKRQFRPLVYRTWRAGGDVRLIAEQAKENERQSLGAGKKGCQKSDNLSLIDTKKELAKIAGVSHDTRSTSRRWRSSCQTGKPRPTGSMPTNLAGAPHARPNELVARKKVQ